MVPTPVRFALAGVGRFFSPFFAPPLSVFSFNLGQILNLHEPLLLGLDSTECFMSKTEEESVFRRTSFGPTFYSQQLYQSRSKRNPVKPAVFQSSTLRLTFLFFSDSPDLVDLAFLEAFTYRNSSTARALPCLVEAPTAHGVHVFFVVILEPSDESSTIKMVIFLTKTLENSRFAPNDQRSAPNNPLTATVSISDHPDKLTLKPNLSPDLYNNSLTGEPSKGSASASAVDFDSGASISSSSLHVVDYDSGEPTMSHSAVDYDSGKHTASRRRRFIHIYNRSSIRVLSIGPSSV